MNTLLTDTLAGTAIQYTDHVAEPGASYQLDIIDDKTTAADHPPMNRHTDPMRPPLEPRVVRCLHCEQRFDSTEIHWRTEPPTEAQIRARAVVEAELCALFGGEPRPPHPDDEHGRWCCPTPGCTGAGYLFDLLPVS